MELCSDNHQEVAYEGRNCPVCEIISDYENQIDSLQKGNERLVSEIESLRDQIANLEGDK